MPGLDELFDEPFEDDEDLSFAMNVETGEQLQEWFESVVVQHYKQLYVVAYMTLYDAHNAEDAVQTAIVKASQRLDQLDDPSRVVGWLKRIVKHTALDMFKIGGSHKTHNIGDNVSIVEREDSHPTEVGPVFEDERQILMNEIAKLPDGQAEVLTLRYLEQLDITEVADRLGISPGTARVRLHRALAWLRRNPNISKLGKTD